MSRRTVRDKCGTLELPMSIAQAPSTRLPLKIVDALASSPAMTMNGISPTISADEFTTTSVRSKLHPAGSRAIFLMNITSP
jgi:hypothetical protein